MLGREGLALFLVGPVSLREPWAPGQAGWRARPLMEVSPGHWASRLALHTSRWSPQLTVYGARLRWLLHGELAIPFIHLPPVPPGSSPESFCGIEM